MTTNKGARPDVLPWFKIQCLDLKVADPATNNETMMLYEGQPFKLILKFSITGMWKPLFVGAGDIWATNFYANALGIDVGGEKSWTISGPLPAPVAPDTYEVSCTVTANTLPPGIYEFGAIARLPSMGINCFGEGDHVEISPV